MMDGDSDTSGSSADLSQRPAVVMDCGTSLCKAGFAGDDAPRSVFPPLVGIPRKKDNEPRGKEQEERSVTLLQACKYLLTNANGAIGLDYYVGSDADNKRGQLILKYPIEYGMVTSWDHIDKIWDHIFRKELRVSPEEQAVLIAQTPFTPKYNTEKTAERMFEGFNVPALMIRNSAVLSLYSYGFTRGVAIETGDALSYVIPVIEGNAILSASMKLEVAGTTLTNYMREVIEAQASDMSYLQARHAAEDIIKRMCYVKTDNDCGTVLDKTYVLPDGRNIKVGEERLKCPEVLFQPILADKEFPGIHTVTYRAINRCYKSIQPELYKHIVVGGRTSLLQGYPERLQKELDSLKPGSVPSVKVHAQSGRQFSSWTGGSMLASMASFFPGEKDKWITKDDYDEYGPTLFTTGANRS